ncbi:MAG: flagellar export protein FliJ [Rhodocyclales bacterium]|nr:flagellar export protein FliJ [Rhodocyclales bacterium]
MSSNFPLQPLLNLSRLHLDEATRKLGELIAGEQEASQRHQLLVQYREEYQTRFMAAAKEGIGPTEWSNYRQFIARIDDAIIQAALSVTLTQQRTLAGQQNWLGKQGRLKAFDTLADRHRSQVTHKEQRAEQKASDEFGARQHTEGAHDTD